MVQAPPTGDTEKGASRLWVSTSYCRTHPAGCSLCLPGPVAPRYYSSGELKAVGRHIQNVKVYMFRSQFKLVASFTFSVK